MDTEYPNAAQKYIKTVDKYIGKQDLHPLVQAINQDEQSHRKLVAVMEHEVNAIRSRSQDLEENEITIAQKAFVYFSASNMHAAIHIYVEEILGIEFAPKADKASLLQGSIDVRAGLLEASKQGQGSESAASTQTDTHAIPANAHSQDAVASPSPAAACIARLSRLEGLLEQGEKEFHGAQPGSYEERNAAKFLRDTIDNTIEYVETLRQMKELESGEDYEGRVSTLQQLREIADAAARQGYNGKPRPFERARQAPPSRPSLRREDAILRSPGAPGRSAVNRIRLNRGREQRGGERRGEGRWTIDRYRPARRG